MKGRQICDFVQRGIAVSRRPPWHDIGDIDVGARDSDRGQHLVEQLSRAADKRDALLVLLRTRRLADEHEPRVRAAVTEHELLRGGLERAALEAVQDRAQILKRRGRTGCGAGRHDGLLGRRRRLRRRHDLRLTNRCRWRRPWCHRLKDGRHVRKTVDRQFAERCIHAGLDVESQQIARGLVASGGHVQP